MLAILAEKCGAAAVMAIDNDLICVENCRENMERNQCRNIEVKFSEQPDVLFKPDVILANIQLNVLLQYRKDFERLLAPGGKLFLSGVLAENEDALANAFSKNFILAGSMLSGSWVAEQWQKRHSEK